MGDMGKRSGYCDTPNIVLAELSHDIRNLLNSIIGCSNLLRNDHNLTETNKNHANTINNSARNLWNILDKIIQISRMKAGKDTIRHSSFDLRVLLEDLKTSAAMQGIPVKIEFLGHAARNLVGDEGRIRQMLTGLLLGAAADGKFAEIFMEIRTLPRGDKEIIAGIINAGRRMHKRVSTRQCAGNTGVHLALSRELAHFMGGKITARESGGYRFEIEVRKGESGSSESSTFFVPDPCRDKPCYATPDLSEVSDDVLKEMRAAAKGARLDILLDLAKKEEDTNPQLAVSLYSAIKSYDYELIFAILHLAVKI